MGGTTGTWNPARLNLEPTTTVDLTMTVNSKSYSGKYVVLNGAIHYIVIPSVTPNGKAWVFNHASVAWDIYHKAPTAWSASYNNMEDEAQRALDRGCYVLSLDAVVGGHPPHYWIQQYRCATAWAVREYKIDKFYCVGGSSGAVNVAQGICLSPELIDGAILNAPIAFDFENDVRYCAAWQQYEQSTGTAGYGWWYDPTDGIGITELYSGFYPGAAAADMSAANRLLYTDIPLIVSYGGDDERTHPDLWHPDYLAVGESRLIEVGVPAQWHGDALVDWTDDSRFATTDPLQTVEAMAEAMTAPTGTYSTPAASTKFADAIDVTTYSSASNAYLSEGWRIGFGSGGGMWDSAVVADVDADADIELAMGSSGGGFFKLQQGADPALNDWTIDQGGAWFPKLGAATNAVAIDDADNAVVGTNDGKLWMIDTAAATVTGGGTNDFGHDIQHLYWTDDLDGDGVDEWWFRTWEYYPTGITGAKLWVVEYNSVSGEFDTEVEWDIGPWASQFFVAASSPHYLVTIHDGRGRLLSYAIAPSKNWKHDTKPSAVSSPSQYCYDLLKTDGTFIYALTIPTSHNDWSDPYTAYLPAKQMLFTFDATTLAKLDQEAIPDDAILPTMDTLSESGTIYVIVGGEGPKVYEIGAGGQITGPTTVAGWTADRVLTCVRAADLDGDTVEEIVGITRGGDIVNFIWSAGWGSTLTIGDQTYNPSKCYAINLHPTSGIVAKATNGYSWRLNWATGATVSVGASYLGNGRDLILWNGTNYFPLGSMTMVDDPAGVAYDDQIRTYLNYDLAGDIIGCLVETDATVLGGETRWYSSHIFAYNPNGYLGARTASADYDIDGDADLSCVTREGVLHMFEFVEGTVEEDPVFTLDYDLGVNPGAVVGTDLYGDGNLELLIPVMADENSAGRVHVLEVDGDAITTLGYVVSSTAYIAPGVGVMGCAVEDLDNDGTDEVVIGCADGTIRVYNYNSNTEEFDLVHRSASYGSFAGCYGGLFIYDHDGDSQKTVYAGGSDHIVALITAAE